MSRPDDRLLVPIGCLPFVPEGARKVLRCDVCGDAQIHYSGCDEPDAGDHCTSPHDCGGRAAWFLDLSAPALRAGVPKRLDVLPWALRLTSWRDAPTLLPCGDVCTGARVWPAGTFGDLTGLTPDQSGRAVVAAALRHGGAK